MSAEPPGYDALVARIGEVTGLNVRACDAIALELVTRGAGGPWSAREIADAAERLGYEFERDPAKEKLTTEQMLALALGSDCTLDPAQVVAEVYMHTPRVRCEQMPRLGKAPAELQKLAPELVAGLPEDVLAMLVKVDLHEGQASFWLYDASNEIDRRIGPIDVRRFADGEQLEQAFAQLVRRLSKVLAADMN